MIYKPLKTATAFILSAFFLAVVFTSPVLARAAAASEEENTAAEAEWTFMVFMAADNNLEAATVNDLNELEKYGSTKDVNFLVQIDRNGNYDTGSVFNWVGARRFKVCKDKTKKIASEEMADLGVIDSADPQTLLDFVSWGKENFPAKKYALVIWNHGTGWKEIQPSIMEGDDTGDIGLSSEDKAVYSRNKSSKQKKAPKKKNSFAVPEISYNISYDDSSKSSMSIPVLGETLEKIKDILEQPVDLLGFDACLMQMAEVTYTSAPSVLYQIGSPDLEPERGWPYDLIAGPLTKKPAMDGKELASIIAEAYSKSYNSGSQGNTAVALSVVDMKKTASFKKALDNFCNAARHNIQEIDKLEAARDAALKYYYGDYADLGDYLRKLIELEPSTDIKSAARSLLRALLGTKTAPGYICKLEKCGDKFEASTGMSIFFPTRQGFKVYRTVYKTHSLAKETEWYNFLSELAAPNMPYLKIEEAILEDNNKDGRIAPGEEVNVLFSIRNLGRKPIESAALVCKTESDLLEEKEFSVTLSKLPAPGRVKLVDGFKFKVREDAPVHSEIALAMTVSGRELPDSTIQTSFLIKEQFSAGGHALMVLTDKMSPAGPVLEDMFKNSKIVFDSWDRAVDGEIRTEVLKNYLDGWVLVTCQDSTAEQSLTDDEVDALDSYLKAGGRLVLNGQDLPFTLRDNPFLASRCKAAFVQDDVNVHVLCGENDFGGNSSFQIFGGDGANNQKWPDEIDPLEGAETIVKYEEGARDMADDREMNGPDHKPGSFTRGITSSGAAAVRVLDGYRLMLFGFGIESVNNKSQRTKIMNDIQTFMMPNTAAELTNLAKAASKRVPVKKTTERVIVERADLLSSVEERLTKQIYEEVKNNPKKAEEVLKTIRSMPDQERKVLKNLEKNVQSVLDFRKGHDKVRAN